MALIRCPECGKEVSDKAAACIGCGCPIAPRSVESKIVVYGYTQHFLINPSVTVYVDGVEYCSVAKGGYVEIPIDRTSEVSFKLNMSKAKIIAQCGQITKVKLLWNRLTGQLVPQIIEVITL